MNLENTLDKLEFYLEEKELEEVFKEFSKEELLLVYFNIEELKGYSKEFIKEFIVYLDEELKDLDNINYEEAVVELLKDKEFSSKLRIILDLKKRTNNKGFIKFLNKML